MIRVFPIAGLLLCLAACAAPTPAPVPPPLQPVACSIDKVAVLPARQVAGAVLVPATVNQTAVQMEVDTGAASSSITPGMATKFGLSPDLLRFSAVIGAGGQLITRNTSVANFQFGRQVWLQQSFVTAPLAHVFNEEPPVVGLLGADHLAGFDIELDLPHGRLTLWQVQGCTGDFAWHGVPHSRVKLRRYPSAGMVAMVEVNGQSLAALIDWGSSVTILNQQAAARLGITPEQLAADRTGHNHGADGNDIEFSVHRFPELRVGNSVSRGVRMEVGAVRLGDADMLLGLDYARTRRLWLSYATDQLFVAQSPRQPAKAKQPRVQAKPVNDTVGPR